MLLEIITDFIFLISWWLGLFNISDPLSAIVFIVINFFLFQIIFYVVPFSRRIADLLTIPFSYARFVIRVNTARTIEEEQKKDQKYKQTYPNHSESEEERIEFGVYNRLEMNSRHDGSNIFFSSTRVGDNFQVAYAPLKLSILIIGGYMVLFPLILLAGSNGYFFHMYFSLVLCHVVLPRGADNEMAFNAMVRNGLIPNFLYYWMVIGMFCLFLEFTLRTGGNTILALILSLFWAFVYQVVMIPVVRFFWWRKERAQSDYPEIGHIPDSDAPTQKSPRQQSLLSPSVHNDMNYD